jgi:hypothetical protein
MRLIVTLLLALNAWGSGAQPIVSSDPSITGVCETTSHCRRISL